MLPSSIALPPRPSSTGEMPTVSTSVKRLGGDILEGLPVGKVKRLRGGGVTRAERATRRAAKKNGNRVSNGKHVTATSKNVAKAEKYQAAREKAAPRNIYWTRSVA